MRCGTGECPRPGTYGFDQKYCIEHYTPAILAHAWEGANLTPELPEYRHHLASYKAYSNLKRRVEAAVQPHDLTFMEWLTLSLAADLAQPTQKAVEKSLSVSTPMVSALVDQLVKKDFLKREPTQADRRVNRLVVTQLGQQKLRRVEL